MCIMGECVCMCVCIWNRDVYSKKQSGKDEKLDDLLSVETDM